MIEIDLLSSVRRERSAAWRQAWTRLRVSATWAIPALTVVALIVTLFTVARTERRVDRHLIAQREALLEAERAASRLRSLADRETRLRSAARSRDGWRSPDRHGPHGPGRVLALLEATMPTDVWIERLQVRQTAVAIEGRGQGLSALLAWVDALSAEALVEGPVDLTEVRHTSAPPGSSREDRAAFTFMLRATLARATTSPAQAERAEADPARSAS